MAGRALRVFAESVSKCGVDASALKAFAFGACLFCLGTFLQWQLAQLHAKGVLFYFDNVLMSIVAGSAMLVYERYRSRELKKKTETIRFINHHVRNALQVIYAASYSLNTEKDTTRVCDAVKRIEWALREVLPGPEKGEMSLSSSVRTKMHINL